MRAGQIAGTVLVVVVSTCLAPATAVAAEGTVAAGPIGGTDLRSAMLPPPGFYAGITALHSHVDEVRDGAGEPVEGLDAVDLTARLAGPFLLYVPDFRVLEGSVGLLGVFPSGQQCGQLVSAVPSRCVAGFGDPYVELSWSRSFATPRPSRDPHAYPILEGPTVSLGLGAVLPIGQYDAEVQRSNGLSIGNNTFDLAPSVAFTYTTPPLLSEGTELSAKLYWNEYGTNPATDYAPGSLINLDFAVSEHIGRVQAGLAGIYATQIEDDRVNGSPVPPDGRRFEYLALGPVLNYDLPAHDAAIRFKATTTLLGRNTGISQVFVLGFVKRLF